ncbi:MAG: endonuclease/exonuclease/phosphatase family protein, partial [Sciscionella sp.]
KTLREFTDAIVAAGGPRYAWREIDPVNDADGGQPGGNIRNVFLFNPARVPFVDKGGGCPTCGVRLTPGRFPQLSASPGRLAPNDPAWEHSRKPLVGQFRFHGHTVFVVGNHFDAKLGDQPTEGRYQPPTRSSEVQRLAQATLVHNFVAGIEGRDPLASVVVLGDLNDYQFSAALAKLTSGHVLTDLIDTLPAKQRYSYVYEGQSQVLDHILTSPGVLHSAYDVVHVNSEFSRQTSDHDPQVLRFTPFFR